MSEDNSSLTTVVEGGVLTYRQRLPRQTDQPAKVLVMIHGYGANDGDVYELVPYVDPTVLVVAPRAPWRYNDDPRGNFKWTDTDINELAVPAKLAASVQKLLEFIEQLPKKSQVPLDSSQLYVGGFSQGAILAYALVSQRPELFRGVIAHSGPFNPEIETQLRAASLTGKPFFVAHGRTDNWVDVEQGRRAAQVLAEIGANVTYKEYDFAHETSEQSRHDLANWLAKQF